MSNYTVLEHKIELLDNAMLACLGCKNTHMAAIWAHKANVLEAQMKEVTVESVTTIRQPTGNYAF